MKRQALGAVIASLAVFVAACGGGDEEPVEPAVDEATEEVEGAADEATAEVGEAAEPTEPDEATVEATDEATTGAAGGSTVLIGMVGTAEDPEAFEITLTDASGAPITEIPAGDYTIEVTDPSTTHNFHLTGGSVDETTSVPEMETTTFEVTLEPGEYTYRCDPHPPMTGTFTVT